MHGMKEETQSRGRSKSRDRKSSRPARREYTTPFDEKGRCHHHKNVQLASKKFNGGWKVLCNACPRCMEEKGDSGDEKSVLSGRSGRSAKSVKSASKSTGGGVRQNANGEYDKNGCCVLHPHIQVAKKRVLGSGWKVREHLVQCWPCYHFKYNRDIFCIIHILCALSHSIIIPASIRIGGANVSHLQRWSCRGP